MPIIEQKKSESAVLLVKCPERKGVVAAVSNFIYEHNGDILHSDQHQVPELKLFMMRLEWEMNGFAFPLDEFGARFADVARGFEMEWRVAEANRRPRVAILVSKSGHC